MKKSKGPKHGKGYKWNLTDERKNTIMQMLKQQYTLSNVAEYLEIDLRTLSRKLKE
jgi:transcriptional regulator with PAS, ATPase and Fis domain